MGKIIDVEERLLGMMAVEKRFISEKQLTECLNTIEFFEPDKTLEEIFLTKEYLTKPQIDRLRQQLKDSMEVSVEDAPSGVKRFGDIALEQNMIDGEQLEEVLDEQKTYVDRFLKVQIGQIMCKKGFLTTAQVGRILESQMKKVLYCKNCKTTIVIHNYMSGQIYQCEACKWDLIEAKTKKIEPEEELDDDDDLEDMDDDEDDDLGQLDILEL